MNVNLFYSGVCLAAAAILWLDIGSISQLTGPVHFGLARIIIAPMLLAIGLVFLLIVIRVGTLNHRPWSHDAAASRRVRGPRSRAR